MGNYMSRVGRKSQIRQILLSQNEAISTYRLAKEVGVKPSTHFVDIVLEAWREGLVAGYSVTMPNGMRAYYWHDPEKKSQGQLTLGI